MTLADFERIIATFLAGAALAYLSLRIYFRQKEYEIVKQRYLEQSLDVISAELESLSAAFAYNWVRCLQLVKEFRDSPDYFERSHAQNGFQDLNPARFNRAAHHRLRVLTGSGIYWEVYQLALSRLSSLNSVVSFEIPQVILAKLDGKIGASVEEVVERSMEDLKPMNQQADRFSVLQSAIHRLSTQLERSKLSFSSVEDFSKSDFIREINSEVANYYASDLSTGALD